MNPSGVEQKDSDSCIVTQDEGQLSSTEDQPLDTLLILQLLGDGQQRVTRLGQKAPGDELSDILLVNVPRLDFDASLCYRQEGHI